MTADLPGLVQQIAHFEARLAADPGSRVFLPLADLYRRAGKLTDAQRILERGLKRHPRFVTARAALGLVLTELGDAEAARIELAAVLEIDPDNVLSLRLLGREASERAAWQEACDLFERLLRLEPEDRHVRKGLRVARRALEQAEPAAAAATSSDPGPLTPPSRAAADAPGFETPTLAELYLRQGHPGKARIIVERILAAQPEHQDARALLARLDAEQDGPANDQSGGARGSARTPDPEEAATPPPRSRPATAAGPQGRGDELDRFRAWLDAAADPSGPVN